MAPTRHHPVPRAAPAVLALLTALLTTGCAVPAAPTNAIPASTAPTGTAPTGTAPTSTAAPAGPARPQDPVPPLPYRAEEVTVPSRDATLAGTLTLPAGPGPHPALVLITGSGQQDRDETIAEHRPFLVLADALTRAGYAVLRTDDRGVGGSGGDYAAADYDVLTDDVLAGVSHLAGRPEVDAGRIGLFGHSEGGYLAPLAAQRAPGAIAFAVLAAGPAVTGEELLVEQNRLLFDQAGATPEQVTAQLDTVRQLAALLRAGDRVAARRLLVDSTVTQVAALPAEQRPTTEQIEQQVDATLPDLRRFLPHDPTASLTALSVPVLALYGGLDLQVSAAQNEPVMTRLLAGNPDATVTTLPGLNHLLQPATTGALTEYPTIDTTVAPAALDVITGWLRELR